MYYGSGTDVTGARRSTGLAGNQTLAGGGEMSSWLPR